MWSMSIRPGIDEPVGESLRLVRLDAIDDRTRPYASQDAYYQLGRLPPGRVGQPGNHALRWRRGTAPQPRASDPAALVADTPISVWTDRQGRAQISLIPTGDLDGRNPYVATVPGVGTVRFRMPDQDTSLYAVIQGSPGEDLPAQQLPNPAGIGVSDGDTIVALTDVWRTGRYIWVQNTAPTPTAGQDALWINTALTPPAWNYWDGTTWQPFALQPNSATSAHIAPGSITEADMASGAVSTRVLADGSVTAPKLAADQPAGQAALRTRIDAAQTGHDHSANPLGPNTVAPPMLAADNATQKEAFRTRIGAEADGHDHSGTGNELAEDTITPGMLQADQPAQKQAFRTRIDTRADIQDWAEDGNADALPPAKIPNLPGDRITAGTLPGDRLQPASVTGSQLADDSVDDPQLTSAVQAKLVPGGGAPNEVLQKRSASDNDDEWGLVERGNIHADVLDLLLPTGGTQGQVLVKQTGVDGDADWQATAAGEDAASWAEQGNNDEIPVAKIPDIPRSKLPPEAFEQYVKEASFTITLANLGAANEGRGFDRVTGGGGVANPDTWTLDGNTLTLLAFEQLAASGEVSIKVAGTLPANFRDRVWIVEAANGYQDILRMETATRYRREPGDNTYPAGLQQYQEIDWASQSLDILYNRAAGSTVTLSIATSPGEHLDDQVAAWARTGNTDDVPRNKIPALAANSVATANIQDGAVTNDKLANNAVDTAELRDGAVTGTKLDSNAVSTGNINNLAITTAKIAAGAVTLPKLSSDVAARLNPMGGAGGQSAADGLVQVVSLWRYSGTVPATSELTTAPPTWGPGGWSNIPTGWSAPAPTSGVGNRFRATTLATWNETTNSFDLGTWTITQETLFNTQYTADPNAVPLVTTSSRVSGSRFWRTRDPNTGHWATIWNALYTGLATWTVLASVPIGGGIQNRGEDCYLHQPCPHRRPAVSGFPSGCPQPCAQPNRHLRDFHRSTLEPDMGG